MLAPIHLGMLFFILHVEYGAVHSRWSSVEGPKNAVAVRGHRRLPKGKVRLLTGAGARRAATALASSPPPRAVLRKGTFAGAPSRADQGHVYDTSTIVHEKRKAILIGALPRFCPWVVTPASSKRATKRTFLIAFFLIPSFPLPTRFCIPSTSLSAPRIFATQTSITGEVGLKKLMSVV